MPHVERPKQPPMNDPLSQHTLTSPMQAAHEQPPLLAQELTCGTMPPFRSEVLGSPDSHVDRVAILAYVGCGDRHTSGRAASGATESPDPVSPVPSESPVEASTTAPRRPPPS